MSKFRDSLTDGQYEAVIEFIASLERDDVENSISNAKRCLEGEGYLELQNMVSNYFYLSGINHAKNELREILGLPRLMTDREKRQLENSVKYPMGSQVDWNCPPLQDHEFEVTEGTARLIPIGDEGTSMIVIGTKDRKKALRMMRRYERDWLEPDLLSEDRDITEIKLAWRKANQGYDGEHTHMFSWSKRDTKNNPNAVHAFLREA